MYALIFIFYVPCPLFTLVEALFRNAILRLQFLGKFYVWIHISSCSNFCLNLVLTLIKALKKI